MTTTTMMMMICVWWWQAHVVAAFEQSLSNMTQRLQQLTVTSQQKVLIIYRSLCLSLFLCLCVLFCLSVYLSRRSWGGGWEQ